MKDDRKDNSYEAIWSAIYSNSESIIWTHASIFEAQQGIITDIGANEGHIYPILYNYYHRGFSICTTASVDKTLVFNLR